MHKISILVAFALGAAVGVAASWQYHKKKYEQLAQEDIASVKAVFSKQFGDDTDDEEYDNTPTTSVEPSSDGPAFDIRGYAAKLHHEGYTNYSDVSKSENNPAIEDHITQDLPHVIAPEEFGEIDGYNTLSLSYYSDNVLADDDDRVIHEVDNLVGEESLAHFGEYEDDSVFVRNDRLKCDFEILLKEERYVDVLAREPYKADD